jgi:hypothetical protein
LPDEKRVTGIAQHEKLDEAVALAISDPGHENERGPALTPLDLLNQNCPKAIAPRNLEAELPGDPNVLGSAVPTQDAQDSVPCSDQSVSDGRFGQGTPTEPQAPSVEAGSSSRKPIQVSRLLMSRYDRQRIYQSVWSMPRDQAGRALGINANIWNVCKGLHIPCPPHGYWQKVAANKPVNPPPQLPPVQIAETGRWVDLESKRSADCGSPELSGETWSKSGVQRDRLGESQSEPSRTQTTGLISLPVSGAQCEESILPPADIMNSIATPIQNDESNRTGLLVSAHNDAEISSHQTESPGTVCPNDEFYVSASLSARYSRERLYQEVWTHPMRTVAAGYAISDTALHKACCKLHVPIPEPGYWAKLAAGKQVQSRPPLPVVQVSNKRQRRHGHPHSQEEQTAILASIALDVSNSETLAQACRTAGICEDTYYRWQKRHRVLSSLSPLQTEPSGPIAEGAPSDSTAAHKQTKHPKSKRYSPADVAVISQRVFEAVSRGKTLIDACAAEGIHDHTYRQWRKRSRDPEYPLWNELHLPNPENAPQWRKKRRRGREHTFEEIGLIRQQIAEAVATGKTILDACRVVEIDESTYSRWLRRWPDMRTD